MDIKDTTPPVIKIVALMVVGSVAKALFAPRLYPTTANVQRVVETAKDVVETAKKS